MLLSRVLNHNTTAKQSATQPCTYGIYRMSVTMTSYGVSNHRQLDCLFNSLLGSTTIQYIQAPRHGSLCERWWWIPLTKGQSCGKTCHTMASLQWRRNGRDGASNHQPHNCLLHPVFRRRSKKSSKLRVTGLCAGFLNGDRWILRTNNQ